jgi:protein TonB
MEGAARVQCTVLDAAGRVHCTVVSETPKGYGFGQQTVKMVEEKGRVDTSVGNIKVGSVLATTTVKWQLN